MLSRASHDAGPRVIAVFDVDHTLVNGDSLLWFGWFLMRKKNLRITYLPGLFYSLLRSPFGLVGSDELKTCYLKTFISGTPLPILETAIEEFTAQVLVPNIFREARERIQWHRDASHDVVLLSASPSLYLKGLAQSLGVDTLIGTELICKDGDLTGEIDGKNCKGDEKLRRLLEVMQKCEIDWSESYGYADSFSDLPVLEHVGRPVLVNPPRRLAQVGRARGWTVESWR